MSSLSSSECNNVYNAYGGKSVTGAAFEGALAGLAGMVGAGGFWNPVSQGALNNIVDGYNDLKSTWSAVVNQYEGELNSAQQEFIQQQFIMVEELDALNNEILQENITKNTLYITIIFVALIIVIIYLMIL